MTNEMQASDPEGQVVEQETITPGRGSPESARWFRQKLETLGLSQNGLARRMLELGDDRRPATIVRCLSRMANGNARVSGEMRALLGMMEQVQAQEMSRTRHGN